MTVVITSPTDGQVGAPNPIHAQGTANAADGDFLEGRWERADGTVWNGARWADDGTAWFPASSALETIVDVARFDRLDSTDAKFSLQWFGAAATSPDLQVLAAHHGTWRLQTVDGEIQLILNLNNGTTAEFTTAIPAEPVVGEQVAYLCQVDLSDPQLTSGVEIYRSIDRGASWRLLGETLNLPGSTWAQTRANGIVAASGVFQVGGTAAGVAGMVDGGYVDAFNVTASSGERIVDLDLTRDLNVTIPPPADATDQTGTVWTPTGGVFDRTRLTHWFTITGLGSWTLASPSDMEPEAHTIAVRAVDAGVPGEPVTSSFVPVRVSDELTDADRYVRRATGRVYWAKTLADPANPTVEEICAAYDITCDLTRDIDGLDPIHEALERAHVWSPFNYAIVGVSPAQTPTLTLLDRVDQKLWQRDLFLEGMEGHLILAPYGKPESGDRVTVLACRSCGVSDSWGFGLSPATITARLAATSETIHAQVGYSPTLFAGSNELPAELIDVEVIPPLIEPNTDEECVLVSYAVDLAGNIVAVFPDDNGTIVFMLLNGGPYTGNINDLVSISEPVTGNVGEGCPHVTYAVDPDGVVVAVISDGGALTYTGLDGAPYTGDLNLLEYVDLESA